MFEQKKFSPAARNTLADVETNSLNNLPAYSAHALKADIQWFRIQRGYGTELKPGDLLCVKPEDKPLAGSLVVLNLDNRLLLRRLQYDGKSLILEPLSGKVQSIRLPAGELLPMVGVVTKIVRSL